MDDQYYVELDLPIRDGPPFSLEEATRTKTRNVRLDEAGDKPEKCVGGDRTNLGPTTTCLCCGTLVYGAGNHFARLVERCDRNPIDRQRMWHRCPPQWVYPWVREAIGRARKRRRRELRRRLAREFRAVFSRFRYP